MSIKSYIRTVEDWWFDTTRSVQTCGNEHTPKPWRASGELRDSNIYGPVRVANARRALRDLPIENYSEYTFIDIGSGKGRGLFLAAELPFRKVIGVEFSTDLHELALANIERFNHTKQKCHEIESIQANAAEFEFPDQKLLLYLFNPFGPDIMGRMLANLERSLEKTPRHVVILMIWPEQSHIVAQMRGIQIYKQTRRYHVFQTFGAAPALDVEKSRPAVLA